MAWQLVDNFSIFTRSDVVVVLIIVPGLLGLIFYPGQGVYKSIYTVTHGRTRDDLKRRRQQESQHKAENLTGVRESLIRQFDSLIRLQTKVNKTT